MEKRAKVCIDRILPRELMRFQPTVRGVEGRVRAISPIGKAWMNGSRLRVKFMGGTKAQHDLVKEQAGWWMQVANLTFTKSGDIIRTKSGDIIRILINL